MSQRIQQPQTQPPPWEQLPDEPAEAFAQFQNYLAARLNSTAPLLDKYARSLKGRFCWDDRVVAYNWHQMEVGFIALIDQGIPDNMAKAEDATLPEGQRRTFRKLALLMQADKKRLARLKAKRGTRADTAARKAWVAIQMERRAAASTRAAPPEAPHKPHGQAIQGDTK